MTVVFRHGDLGTAGTNITAKVRQPGGGAAAWTLTEAAEKGAPAMSGFATEDPAAAVSLVGQKEVHAEDTAAADPTIFAGFFDTRHVGRAGERALIVAGEREWDATTTDLNVLLSDYIIGSGKRPAESDIERIDWLLSSGYLPLGDAGFIDRDSPTALPAADYTGRFASDVLAECCNLSGKNYFVRWEQGAFFPDPSSPWAPDSIATTFVPPDPAHVPPIPSALDVLGGRYGGPPGGGGSGDTYVPAPVPVYPSTSEHSAGGNYAFFGPSQWDANCNPHALFGHGLFVIQTGGMVAAARWTWDLEAAGRPPIATVGLNFCGPRLIPGWPLHASWSIQVCDLDPEIGPPGWVTLFDQADIDALWASGGAPLVVPAAHLWHRYWSVYMTFGVEEAAMEGDWASMSGGFLLWKALGTPGPVLCYHDYNWAGDSSGCSISNVLSEIDNVTVFGPSPGDRLTRNPGRVYSGCWFEYSGGHVYETNPTTLGAFRHRDVRSSDMNCQTVSAASALALAYLARCATEEDRYVANLDNVPASSLGLMRPGQRIPVHLTHVDGYTEWTYMAIMRRSVTAVAAGSYKVQLELANPVLTGFQPGAFLSPSLWSNNIGQVVAPAPSDLSTAVSGQRVPPTFITNGDGWSVSFGLPGPYIPGSLLVWVDALPVEQASIFEVDPAGAWFQLDFAPAGADGSVAAQAVVASWQVA
jgi:hypothetical protein